MKRGTKLIALTLVLMAAGYGTTARADVTANKQLVRDFTEATNNADWDALKGLVAENFVRHSAATPGPPVKSREEFIQLQKGFLKSFPDQHVTLDQVIAEGNYVAIRATYSGTLQGPLGGMPATGKSARSPFLAMIRIESGQIAELWVEWDNMAMLGQLGLFPPVGAGGAEGASSN